MSRHKPATELAADGFWHMTCPCGVDRIWFRETAAQKDAERHEKGDA